MGKSTFIICAVNMVASAVALFLIFRSPAKPQIQLAPQSAETAKPLFPPEEIWSQFAEASNMQTASNLLAKLPTSEVSSKKAADYIQLNNPVNTDAANFVTISRVGACIRFLGTQEQWGLAHIPLLQSIAKDRQSSVVIRDLALRTIIDLAIRKHAAKNNDDNAWRADLADFLLTTDFGNETCIGGLALQAAVFIESQGIAAVDKAVLTSRVRAVLDNHTIVQESTLLAALEVCTSVRDSNLADSVRTIAKNPRSEAVLQMTVFALGKIGTNADQAWLVAQLPTASPALYRTTEAAWLGLKSAEAQK
jgi:hypothetical protein